MPNFIRGTTFAYAGPLQAQEAGNDLDLTGASAICQVRTAGTSELVAALQVTISGTVGSYTVTLRSTSSTANWPLRPMLMDIRLTLPGGDVLQTTAASFTVVSGVSR